MPYADPEAAQAYQRRYYQSRKRLLAKRAKLRQRLKRGTQTLWSILPTPESFCAAMAQKAINDAGGMLPPGLEKGDLEQEIAEALVRGKAASQCRNAIQYAATLAIRVAQHEIRQANRMSVY